MCLANTYPAAFNWSVAQYFISFMNKSQLHLYFIEYYTILTEKVIKNERKNNKKNSKRLHSSLGGNLRRPQND